MNTDPVLNFDYWPPVKFIEQKYFFSPLVPKLTFHNCDHTPISSAVLWRGWGIFFIFLHKIRHEEYSSLIFLVKKIYNNDYCSITSRNFQYVQIMFILCCFIFLWEICYSLPILFLIIFCSWVLEQMDNLNECCLLYSETNVYMSLYGG